MMRRVVKKEPRGSRFLLTMECGHTGYAIHPDDEVDCIACSQLAPPMRFALKHPLEAKYATYDTRSGPSLTTNENLRYQWPTPEQAESQRKLYEAALHTGLLVVNVETGEVIPSPFDERARIFREKWRSLFPDTTQDEFLILDNCAGLEFLREEGKEVIFFTTGETVGLDKRTDIQVIVAPMTDCESRYEIQVWKNYENAGRSCIEQFEGADELACWFRDIIGN